MSAITTTTEATMSNEARDAIDGVLAYYRHHYGPMHRDDALDLVRRIVEGSSYFTLAELRSLEAVGLAYGYSTPRPADAPRPWPQGPTALAAQVYEEVVA